MSRPKKVIRKSRNQLVPVSRPKRYAKYCKFNIRPLTPSWPDPKLDGK